MKKLLEQDMQEKQMSDGLIVMSISNFLFKTIMFGIGCGLMTYGFSNYWNLRKKHV